ncbi:DUF5629 family protein [Pseudomonas baltica]|jgi:hypothetical protein|uniref:DUF5629 family protein n=1 Tax=Pseudomonas baltica TaxID=2762576 RepID=UPI00289FA450|nr:DUF5629 family protein [Pseudomonas baltica]
MTDTLITALQSTDMLLIDNLHAFDFTLDASGLRVECMDGRDLKRWTFTPAQIAAAAMNIDLQAWCISDDTGAHQLVCVQAFGGQDEEHAEQE